MNKLKFLTITLCLCLITPIFKYMQVDATRDRAIEEMMYESFMLIDENGNPIEVKLEDVSSEEKEVSVEDKYEVIDNIGGEVVETYATEEEAQEAVEELEGTQEDLTVQPFNLRTVQYGTVYITTNKAYSEYKMVHTGETGYISGAYGRDGAYIGEFNGKIRTKIAGVVADFNPSDVDVVTYGNNRVSYYIVEDGYLMHYFVYGSSNNYNGLRVGFELDYLEPNVKYYSYDGHYFYDTYAKMIQDYQKGVYTQAVNANQPYYNYYQYLSHRALTNLTAEDFDKYTRRVLESEAAYQSSKFYQIGQYLLESQNKYTVNAAMIYGVGYNESNIGRSAIALNKNNLFGHSAYDENPYDGSDTYKNVQESINAHAYNFISRGYLDFSDWRHNGAHLGDKEAGINVRYASDPYWGEKAACRAYYMDGATEDYGKSAVGIIKGAFNSCALYKEPSTNSKVITNLVHLSNIPVLILEEVKVDETTWYKIASDTSLEADRNDHDYALVYNPEVSYLYIQADKVQVVWEGENVLGQETPTQPENPGTDVENPDQPGTDVEKPNEDPQQPTITIPTLEDGHKIQLTETTFTVEPKTSIKDIKSVSDNVIVKKGDTEITDENALIGTGYTVIIGETTYTIVKSGDVNGDGRISPADYMVVKNNIMGTAKLEGAFWVSADSNSDGRISPADYMKIKNMIMGN